MLGVSHVCHTSHMLACRIDVVTKEDALDFLQTEENRQKNNA